MKTNNLIFVLIFSFFLTLSIKAQENNTSIRYVYSETTTAALTELELFCRGNKSLYVSISNKVKKLELNGKVILSTSEFNAIKKRLNSTSNSNSITDAEFETFKNKAKQKYILITDLFK